MLRLRAAEVGDWARLWAWRTDVTTEVNSREPAPPTLDAHMKWLRTTLKDPQVRLFVAFDDGNGRAIGTGRLTVERDHLVLSMTVEPSMRGHGHAGTVVAELVHRAAEGVKPPKKLVAEVRADNVASLRAFASNEFLPSKEKDGWVRLERVL